jgi:5-methylcytosine-specific restriction endonuclease McrA
MRTCVYRRDNGICAECKQDTKKIARDAKKLRADKNWKQYYELLETNNIPKHRKIWSRGFGGGLWDADHIVAVKEGGGDCGLDNIRTLCIPCHKINTSKQRKSWAVVKKIDN